MDVLNVCEVPAQLPLQTLTFALPPDQVSAIVTFCSPFASDAEPDTVNVPVTFAPFTGDEMLAVAGEFGALHVTLRVAIGPSVTALKSCVHTAIVSEEPDGTP